MSTKRKRGSEDEESSQLSKHLRQDEPVRSGRVRKKPAKFVEDSPEAPDVSKLPVTPSVTTPARQKVPTVKQTTMSPVYAASIKEESQSLVIDDFSSTDEDVGKTPNRSSRARKKSAKVLEMEEFEEAEKKQVTKKDAGKKTKSPFTHAKEVHQESSATLPIPVLKIKDIPTFSKMEPVPPPPPASVQISPQKSPVAGSSVGKSPTTSGSAEKSSASVIKLLLSSPTQSSKSSLSTSSVSQPPKSETKASTKKSKAKGSANIDPASQPQKPSSIRKALEMPQTSLPSNQSEFSPVKQNLSIKQRLNAALETTIKSESMEISEDIKQEQGLVTVMPVPTINKEQKLKKVKKEVSSSDESPFLSPPMPSPNVIHVGPVNMGLEVKAENDGRKKKVKVKNEPGMSAEMLHEDFGLDMPEIELDTGNDSFMEMEDEDGLLITEEEVVTSEKKPGKDLKKGKTPKGKKAKSNIQLEDMSSTDGELVMDFSRMKSEDKKKKKDKTAKEEAADKKKRSPTAYMLWCSANRPRLVNDNPGIDFSTISKTLGEMWSNLSEKDKILWKRKAKKAAGKGSTLITTGKTTAPKLPGSSTLTTARQMAVMSQKMATVPQALITPKQTKPLPVDDLSMPVKGFGIEPLDVAAHLKIVGESLSIIGMKLQEHRGLIAVQGSLSVLLDSMMCAVAPLMCLTAVLPETNGLPAETHMKNLDNIAYIMPGL